MNDFKYFPQISLALGLCVNLSFRTRNVLPGDHPAQCLLQDAQIVGLHFQNSRRLFDGNGRLA